jgi:hypothetical protein
MRDQLEVFRQIEHPDFQPVALAADEPPCTFGELYDAIMAAIGAVRPPIDPLAFAVPLPNTRPLATVGDALLLLERIKEEGEGRRDSPDQPSGDRVTLAHYYSFKEIYVQRRLVYAGTCWAFEGDPIELPEVYDLRNKPTMCGARTLTSTRSPITGTTWCLNRPWSFFQSRSASRRFWIQIAR